MLDFDTTTELIEHNAYDVVPYADDVKTAKLPTNRATIRSIAPHEHLFHECDTATHCFEVLEGAFCVYKLLPDGRRYIVSFAMPGDLVGFGAEDVHALNAEAIESSIVRPVAFNSLDDAMRCHPGLAQKLLHHARLELADAREQLVTVARKSAMEKLATFLIKLSERNRARGQNEDVVHLPMTRCDIADFLGLTLETVSRSLSKLKHAGVIALPKSSKVVIQNRNHLEWLAES